MIDDSEQGRRVPVFGRVLAANLVLCEVLIAAMVALVATGVIARAAFGHSLDMVEDYCGYLLVAVVFLSISVGLREGGLLRVDFLFERLAGASKLWTQLVFDAMSLVFTLILLRFLWRQVASSFERGIVSNTSAEIPLWIPQAVMPLGAAMLALALIEQIALGIARLRAAERAQ